MKIVILVDEYLPSGTRVHSKMMHDLAIEFSKRGHKVTVITPGEPNQNSKLLIDFLDDIEVLRFRSGYTRGVGLFFRAVNEFLLSFKAWNAIRRKARYKKFDLCINYSPTIFFGPLANKINKRGAYSYLVLRDMFPQWIIDQGIIKNKSLPASIFRHFEKLNYFSAQTIGVMSEHHADLMKKNFPNIKDIQILRNWRSDIKVSLDRTSILNELNIEDKIIFFYGGNVGYAQDMKNIIRLAKALKDQKTAHFLIVGSGDEYELIQNLKTKWQLDNLSLMPPISQDEYAALLQSIDIGLFSLSKKHTAHNFPGKLLGYMSASKPILGSVNYGNDLLPLVNDSMAGLIFVNGEDKLFKEAALRLLSDENLRIKMGIKGQELLKQKFSVEHAADTIISKVNKS